MRYWPPKCTDKTLDSWLQFARQKVVCRCIVCLRSATFVSPLNSSLTISVSNRSDVESENKYGASSRIAAVHRCVDFKRTVLDGCMEGGSTQTRVRQKMNVKLEKMMMNVVTIRHAADSAMNDLSELLATGSYGRSISMTTLYRAVFWCSLHAIKEERIPHRGIRSV